MAERGAWANIRAMPNRVKTFPFSAWVYRQRNAVERFFNKLKHFRAVATRYDKRDDNFLASVQLASIRIWLRSYESSGNLWPLPSELKWLTLLAVES